MKLTEGPATVYEVALDRVIPVVDLDLRTVHLEKLDPGKLTGEISYDGLVYRVVAFQGMIFTGEIITPPLFHVGTDKGTWDFVQMVNSVDRRYHRNGTTTFDPGNFSGAARLDNIFPYAQGKAADSGAARTQDHPSYLVPKGQGLTAVFMSDSFTMYWLYKPPRKSGFDSKYVAVAKCEWAEGVSAISPEWEATGTLSGGLDHSIGTATYWPKQPEWTQKVSNSQ